MDAVIKACQQVLRCQCALETDLAPLSSPSIPKPEKNHFRLIHIPLHLSTLIPPSPSHASSYTTHPPMPGQPPLSRPAANT